MRLFTFDASSGHHVDRFGSNFVLAPLTDPTGMARVACMHLEPGGLIGEHEAVGGQLFCVVSGRGWVSGDEGERQPITAMQAAFWDNGELHAAGTDEGLVAVVLEGSFTPWARELAADR
ncbi:MAG TPA: hypothetical protein VF230_07960 [Acidimicrobiales bacterium]